MPKRQRVIGTSIETISKAETELGFRLPDSFRHWLLDNNGLSLDGINIFPVFDERDPRKTWDSIVRQHESAASYWADVFEDEDISFTDLLAFGDCGTGDYYCFDYSAPTEPGEYLIVLVSHETGERQPKARTFTEFVEKANSGVFDDD